MYTKAQEVPRLRIDPAHAYGGNVSEYFETVEYIPLETTKESLFGDVYEIVVTDSSYVISDIDTRSIYFFSHSGKFITKVKNLIWFFHERVKNQIVVGKFDDDPAKEEFIYYSLQGKKLKSRPMKIDSNRPADFFEMEHSTPLGNDYFLNCNSCDVTDPANKNRLPCYFLSIYKNNQLHKQLIPAVEEFSTAISRIWGSVTPPTDVQNGSFYVSTPLDYRVFKVNKDTAIQLFQFIFPQNRVLPKEVIESNDVNYIDSLQDAGLRKETLILNLVNISLTGSKLFFKILPGSYRITFNNSINEYQYNFVYDTSSQKLISFDRMTPDSLSSFLPIMSEGSKHKGLLRNNEHLYGYISSLALFASKEATQNKNPQYPPVLQQYFKTQNRKSNPVIVKMKLKD